MKDRSPMTAANKTRAAPIADKRAAILDAALGLFAERGFTGTAVPEIAAAAGVATGTIYRYFPGKDALLNTLYQQWKGELKRRLIAEPMHAETWRDEFHHWWSTLTRFAHEQPLAYRFLDQHYDEPHLDSASMAVTLQLDAHAVALIERGQASGELRTVSAPLLVALVFGAFSGVVRASAMYGTATFGDDPFAEAEASVWDLIRSHR